MWRKGNPLRLSAGMQPDTTIMENSMEIKKLVIKLPYDPAIPLVGMQPEEARVETDTCTPRFAAALFTTARTGKNPRCPSTDEWTRKLWYIYTMEYCSAIKSNVLESVLMR